MAKEIILDKKALEWACKQLMLNDAKNSKYIKENTSFAEQLSFVKWLGELTYEQTIMLCFDKKYIKVSEQTVAEPKIREKEGKIKKALKYGFAYWAGSVVGAGAGIKAGSNILNKGGSIGNAAGSYTGLVALGSSLGLLALYMYRRHNDVCFQRCKTSPDSGKCQAQCKIMAANQVLNNIKMEMGKCNRTPKPEKCKAKLQKMAIKWNKILMNNKQKLGQL